MKIFYDHTEDREGTRLPKNVIDAGIRLVGLERETGADLLLSPLEGPPLKELNIPGKIALQTHCLEGMLIQRKSGCDFLSSIGDFEEILCRMQQWGGLCWLVYTGNFKRASSQRLYCDGHLTHVYYNQMVGALDSWQLRGGGITYLESDDMMGSWIKNMLDKLNMMNDEKERLVFRRPKRQTLSMPSHKDEKMASTIMTLSTFPGIGHKTAKGIFNHCGNLALSISELSRPNGKLPGVGPKTMEKCRTWLGLDDWEDGGGYLEYIIKESEDETG